MKPQPNPTLITPTYTLLPGADQILTAPTEALRAYHLRLMALRLNLVAGFAEAKEPSSDAKHSVSHSSKNTAKKDVAVNKSKKEKVAASKKSAKSEKVALKDAKKVKISAKNKATKSEKIAKKTSKTEKVAKKSLKTGKTVAQKYTPSTKVERDAQRKDRNREKLAKISRTGKISPATKTKGSIVVVLAIFTRWRTYCLL